MDWTAQAPSALARELLNAPGALLVTRASGPAARPAPGQPGTASDYVAPDPDIFIAVLDDARVLAFNGHVDLGTGIRTSLTQIVAEELDVAPARVRMLLGHTGAAPNQGPTIASASLQISAVPLRRAAALAREALRTLAAERLGCDAGALEADDGVLSAPGGASVSYWQLLAGRHRRIDLSTDVQLKPAQAYRIVGHSLPRVDLLAKATGSTTYVHDVRLPGMWHGRVVRPPYAGRDAGAFVGTSLLQADAQSLQGLPGDVRLVVIGDFIGVVAEREEQAVAAARRLRTRWATVPDAPDLSNLERALREQPSVPRVLVDRGEVDAALNDAQPASRVLRRTYVWPYQMHASIGPSCAVADCRDGRLTVWSGTQNPHVLRIDLAQLTGLGEGEIEIVRLEASGCYGRNGADDVCGDAALLSRAVGRPVRVQWSREQEHAWEPKGAAQLIDVAGAIDAQGELAACDFSTRYPSNDAPMLALLLTGVLPPEARVLEMGDRTAVPPYRYPRLRAVCHDMAPLVRASWLRGVSALPNSFAHECLIDELAELAGEDRLAFRLRHLDDERAADLCRALAQRAQWVAGAEGSRGRPERDGLLHGRGFGYARYVHSKFPGFGAAWAAWVIDLTVDPRTGRIRAQRLFVGQDNGLTVNPAGVRHQIHGNVIQTLSRTLTERVAFDATGVTSREWGGYPILGFKDLPTIDVLLMHRPDEPPLGAGESASVPGPGAIAGALFDATGLRFRRPPFLPGVVRAGLESGGEPSS